MSLVGFGCFLLGLGLALATAVMLLASYPLKGLVAPILAIWAICFGQIVLLSEILSELGLIGRSGFLIGHALLAVAAGLTRWAKGWPPAQPPIGSLLAAARALAKTRPFLLLVAAGVSMVLLGNLLLPMLLPLYNGDAYAYHIPRAYMWWQTGTAWPFPTNDFRQAQFPPNGSYVLAWTMALSGGYRMLHVLQWSSAVAGALSLVGLARIAGHSVPAALFAGLLFPLFPLVIYQMGTAQNDIVVAALGLAAILFAMRSIDQWSRKDRWMSEACLAGLAAGLAIGTKLTLVYLVVPAVLGTVAFAMRRAGRQCWRPLVGLALASAAAVVIFGAYQYVLNWLTIGHPLYNERLATWVDRMSTPENRNLLGSLFRTIYGTLDWVGLLSGEHPILLRQVEILRTAMQAMGLNPDNPVSFADYRYLTNRPPSAISGYSIIAFPAILASLIALPIMLYRSASASASASTDRSFVSALFVMMGWGTIIFCTAWMIWHKTVIRYQISGIALILIGTLPWLYYHRVTRYALAFPAAVLALYVGSYSTLYIDDRADPANLVRAIAGEPVENRIHWGTTEKAVQLLRRNFADGSKIALAGGSDTPWFLFIQPVPNLRFEIVDPKRGLAGVDTGEFAATLVDSQILSEFTDPFGFGHLFLRAPATDHLRLVLPYFTYIRLFVPEPTGFFESNLGFFGLRRSNTGTLIVSDVQALSTLDAAFWRGKVDFMVPRQSGQDLVLVLPLAVPAGAAHPGSIQCNDVIGDARLKSDMLLLRIPAAAEQANELFINCQWTSSSNFSLLRLDNGSAPLRRDAKSMGALLVRPSGAIMTLATDAPWPSDAAVDAAIAATREPTTPIPR